MLISIIWLVRVLETATDTGTKLLSGSSLEFCFISWDILLLIVTFTWDLSKHVIMVMLCELDNYIYPSYTDS